VKSAVLAAMILFALASAMPTASAATRTPFSGQLTFNYGVCADPTPINPCQWWKYAWVEQTPSGRIVHIRGIHGTWTLSGTMTGSGDITRKNADISWATWSMSPVPEYAQDYAFQAWGTIDGHTMFIWATIHHGQIYYGTFEMRGDGTVIQGKVTAADWNTSTATLEGWIAQAS
jgi:hypothetical protein